MIRAQKLSKILIVDDMPKNIQIVANILKNEGYQMTFARDGKTALEKIRQIDFDLVLLDIIMPEMDGFEVCNRLKQTQKTNELPIIFLTAKNDADSIVKGLESGAVDYINKPFNDAELKARVRTHLQLKQMREKLAEANATKDKFFSIIAHDLRNPFNHLLGFSELLIDQFDSLEPSKKKEFLENIHVSLQHVYRLLENLLSWSRVQLGTFEWTPEPIDLKRVVNDSILLLKAQAETKRIGLFSEIADPFVAFADLNMIETVVRNLITNAVKFTPENGKVWLEAASLENCIEISVKDTGIGIADDQIERLFKTGIKYTRTGTNNETGTGLGLILCKEFVEKNGGRIWVESSVGKGSCFRFSIPRSEQTG